MGIPGTIELHSAFRSRDIAVKAALTENGIAVLIAGGDLPHIGAVSSAGPDLPLQTTVFPGHKEAAITEIWAGRLLNELKIPTVVSAGIHYDGITKEEIGAVLEICSSMLNELLEKVKNDLCR